RAEAPRPPENATDWLSALAAIVLGKCTDFRRDAELDASDLARARGIGEGREAMSEISGSSFACLVQLCEGLVGGGTPAAVVNGCIGGYGKLFSRFLYLLEPAATAALRRWNAASSRKDLLMELTDASFFNANVHPILMPLEVQVPGGQQTLSRSRLINVTDLC